MISHTARVIGAPKGRVENSVRASSVERDRVSALPSAISAVEAKKAVPFWSEG